MLNELGIFFALTNSQSNEEDRLIKQIQYHVLITGEWTQYMKCRIAGQKSLYFRNFGSKSRLCFLHYVASSRW